MKVCEKYYTIADLCLLLSYSHKWIVQQIKDGKFGTGVLDINGEYRIPASGVNLFVEQHPFLPEGIKPRARGSFLRPMRVNGGKFGEGNEE